MYNLSLEGTGRQGYFRWKEDICAFIGRHWNFLLGSRSSQTDNKVLLSIDNVPALTFLLHASLQEEDVHLVEHGSGLPVGRKPRLLPLRSAGVRRAWLVEAGPQPTSDPATRSGQIRDKD